MYSKVVWVIQLDPCLNNWEDS